MANTTIFRLRFNRSYTIFAKTGRGHVTVNFVPVVISGRTENSQFSTADKEVIEALKKHEHFGSIFYMEEDGQEVSAKPAKPSPAVGDRQPGAAKQVMEQDGGTPRADIRNGSRATPKETEAGVPVDGTEHPNPVEKTEKSGENEDGADQGSGEGSGSSPEETEAGAGNFVDGDETEHPNPEEETEKFGADEGEGGSETDAAAGDPGDGDRDGLTHDKGVTSKNKAIAFLLEKYNATFAQTADIPAMKEEARTVYSLVFDNWK